MSKFKVPDSVPQDLLLIQEMVGVPPPPKEEVSTKMDEDSSSDISSSDSEDEKEEAANSEDEIEAKLVDVEEEDSEPPNEKPASEPSHSDSDSSSDSEEDEPQKDTAGGAQDAADVDDDEEGAPVAGSGGVLQTKHEVLEVEIAIPEVDTIDPSEHLEKVGDVMTVMDNLAIVRGLASDNMNRGSQKALDTDTLLVFDDRTVMGYIYETFGPTHQPFYQVKYNSKYPLDRERVKVSREVFMVPSKSRFVFVDHIKAFKGSDASNVYDEEPADDELEFSDDEAEAAYKSRMKRKRSEARGRSVTQSREATPNPSHMRDYELVDDVVLGRNAYDENSPYDDPDFSNPGPSRPPPIAYDDPYSMPLEAPAAESYLPTPAPPRPVRPLPRNDANPRGRGRGGGFGHNNNNRGRGRGGGGGGYDGRRGGFTYSGGGRQTEQHQAEPYTPQGQSYYHQEYNPQQPVQSAAPAWGYPASGGMMPPYGGQGTNMPFVQPHINPLFASAFGFPLGQGQNMGYGGQANQYPGAGYRDQHQHQPQQYQQPWNGQWAPPSNGQYHSGGQGQG